MDPRSARVISWGNWLFWALIAFGIAWFAWPVVARAHGEYAWIQKEFGQCCGPADCFPIALVPETRNGRHGYMTGDGDWIPHTDTLPSRDPGGQHWRCYHVRIIFGVLTKGKPRERCTFVSPGTM